MTLDQCRSSLQRLIPLFFQTDPSSTASWIGSLFEALSWMPHDRFDQVCISLAKSSSRKPLPSNFITTYNRLRDDLHWPSKSSSCNQCNGRTLIYKKLFYIPAQKWCDDVMIFCPSCRPNNTPNPDLWTTSDTPGVPNT